MVYWPVVCPSESDMQQNIANLLHDEGRRGDMHNRNQTKESCSTKTNLLLRGEEEVARAARVGAQRHRPQLVCVRVAAVTLRGGVGTMVRRQ